MCLWKMQTEKRRLRTSEIGADWLCGTGIRERCNSRGNGGTPEGGRCAVRNAQIISGIGGEDLEPIQIATIVLGTLSIILGVLTAIRNRL